MIANITRLLVTVSFIAGASVAQAGTEADWSGPAEPKREIASESLEDTLRSWDRADYASNQALTEEERIEREILEANGPVAPVKKYAQKKSSAKKLAVKKNAVKKIAKKHQKRAKSAKKVAIADKKRIRR